MQEHSFLPDFSDDDVIEFAPHNLVKTGRIRDEIRIFFSYTIEDLLKNTCLEKLNIKVPTTTNKNYSPQSFPDKFLGEGVRCQLFKRGSTDWQKGKIKVRVSVEFEPDEPEIKESPSPLDDIRASIN